MRHLAPTDPAPSAGSVVLLHGPTGTAYQRYFVTGRFHSPGHPAGISYDTLQSLAGRDGVLLIHDADQYEDPR